MGRTFTSNGPFAIGMAGIVHGALVANYPSTIGHLYCGHANLTFPSLAGPDRSRSCFCLSVNAIARGVLTAGRTQPDSGRGRQGAARRLFERSSRAGGETYPRVDDPEPRRDECE